MPALLALGHACFWAVQYFEMQQVWQETLSGTDTAHSSNITAVCEALQDAAQSSILYILLVVRQKHYQLQ